MARVCRTVLATNEDVEVVIFPHGGVAIGLQSEHRSLEGQRFDAVGGERVDHEAKLRHRVRGGLSRAAR